MFKDPLSRIVHAPECVRGEGLGQTQIRFCVDERAVGGDLFERYRPQDFYVVEVFSPASRPPIMFTMYAYTHEFIRRRLEGGRALSWFLPCHDPAPGV